MLTGWRFLGGFADDAPECGPAPPPSSRVKHARPHSPRRPGADGQPAEIYDTRRVLCQLRYE